MCKSYQIQKNKIVIVSSVVMQVNSEPAESKVINQKWSGLVKIVHLTLINVAF